MSTASLKADNKKNIKIAIPMLDGKFCEHFGSAKAFLVYDCSHENQMITNQDVFAAPEHKQGAFPKWLKQQNIHSLVSSSIGERALNILEKLDINVFLADENTEPSHLATACLAGKLVPANIENTRCHGHHHDGHECHH